MSYIDRKTDLLSYIGESYASQVQQQSIQENKEIIEALKSECGSNECPTCIQNFPGVDRDTLRDTVCFGLCTCILNDVSMASTIIWKPTQTIDTGKLSDSLDEIIKDVKKKMEDKYGPTNTFTPTPTMSPTPTPTDPYDQVITDVVTRINEKSDQIVNQMVGSSEIIAVKGSGTTVNKVHMTITINAVMNAISDVCSGKTLCDVDTLIQEQMEAIQKAVKGDIQSNFAYVWQRIKKYVIYAGIFFVVILLTIAVLLIYKALNPKVTASDLANAQK